MDLNSSIRLLLRYNSTKLCSPANVSSESTKLSSRDSWLNFVNFLSSSTAQMRFDPASKRRSSGRSPAPSKVAKRLRSTASSSNDTHGVNFSNEVNRFPLRSTRLRCVKPLNLQSSPKPRSLKSKRSVYPLQFELVKPVGRATDPEEPPAPEVAPSRSAMRFRSLSGPSKSEAGRRIPADGSRSCRNIIGVYPVRMKAFSINTASESSEPSKRAICFRASCPSLAVSSSSSNILNAGSCAKANGLYH
mmetsp:Transcript_138424/g.442411  ORF Transcript_138424/g.442411 Transcript_138424/m.442411 type:complete len:247 (+) Transcript_138424:1552-2292(+)